MSTMTLEQAIAVLNPEPKSYQAIEAWKVVRAHLAQPAQAVDVVAIREVIKRLEEHPLSDEWKVFDQCADKLTRAISGEKVGLVETLQQALADISKAAISDQPEFAIRHYVEQRADEAWDGIWRPEYSRPMTTASPAPDKEGEMNVLAIKFTSPYSLPISPAPDKDGQP